MIEIQCEEIIGKKLANHRIILLSLTAKYEYEMWKGRWKVFQWTLTLRKSGVRIQRTTKSSTRKGYHAFRPFSPSTLDFFAVILPRIYHGIFILPLGFHPRRTPSRFYRRLILRLPAGSDVLMRVVLLGRENIAVNFFLFFKHDRFDKTNFSLLESFLFFFFAVN